MEKLKVKNFGPISNLDIELKRINVFIGEQGSGKSTIAKLLSCCRDFLLHYFVARNDNGSRIAMIFKIHGIDEFFKDNTEFEYFDTDPGVLLKYSDGQFSISYEEIAPEQTISFALRVLSRSLQEAFRTFNPLAREEINEKEMADFVDGNSNLVASYLRSSFYCPAERAFAGILSDSISSIFLGNVPLPQTLIEFMSFYEKAKKEFSDYTVPFLGVKFDNSDGVDRVKGPDYSVPFRNASSGLHSIIPLLMVIDYCLQKNCFSSFTVEEPELNLFPINQLHLLRSLIVKTNKCPDESNWTLTTHSPYILSTFNISLLAGIIQKKFPESVRELNEQISDDYIISPDDIAVYALSHEAEDYCRSILNAETGLIDSNYLDSVSETISSEFHSLYRLYISLSKGRE